MKNIIILLLIILPSCLVTPAMEREQMYINKIEALEKELQEFKSGKSPIHVVSPIVELKADYSKIPTYCLAEKYSIVKMGDRYFVRLPYGTIGNDYATPQEAQMDINDYVKNSMDRWIKTGGKGF